MLKNILSLAESLVPIIFFIDGTLSQATYVKVFETQIKVVLHSHRKT